MPIRSDPRPGQAVAAGSSRPIDELFDVAFANEIARLESYNKHHYRPNTYMHKWWARRCGSTFRLILKQLVAEPARRDYYTAGGLEGKVVLDPMMGGGTTLHEALRLGASVIGVDIDPIPVLQARATLSPLPLSMLEAAFDDLSAALQASLGPLFQTHCRHCPTVVPLRFMLYGAQRRCHCGPVLIVDSLVLRHDGSRVAVRICPRCRRVGRRQEPCACGEEVAYPPLVEKSEQNCGRCRQPYVEEIERPYYARYTPLVVVGHCPEHGLFFTEPAAHDHDRLTVADARREEAWGEVKEAFNVGSGPKSRDLLGRGVTSYLDLFSSRQLLYLRAALAVLPRFEPLVRLNLALLLSTSLEFNSLLCGYKGASRGERPGAIRHTFSYHAYAFPYTALENNVLFPQKASGTLQKLFHDRIRRARQWARAPRERHLNGDGPRFRPVRGEQELGEEAATASELAQGERRFLLSQSSAARLELPDASVDFVVTDPPYFDSVQYSDLAAFFRVWLQQLLPDAARWHYDLEQSAVDPHANGNGQYSSVLSAIFGECRRVLRPSGRLIFTFHNWKPQGWAALTLALQRADFRLVNHYVVHAENPASVHIANMRSLVHDAILVLAPHELAMDPAWQRPAAIDQTDSARFCGDCATLLGWLLQEQLPEQRVARVWRRALS